MGKTAKTKSKVKVHRIIGSRTDFFYYAFRNVLLVSVPLLIFSIFIFAIPHSSAEISSGTDNIQLALSTSCTVNAVVTSEHTVSLNGGQLDNNVGNTKLSAFCNDNNGYSIYAVGSSNNIDGNTDLVNTVNESYNIRTGVYNDTIQTNPSSWAMKLTAGTGTGIDPTTGGSVPTTPPTIINGYDNYSAIPNVYTQVAKRTSGTSMTSDTSVSGSYLNTTYQIYANSAQPAGTYNGKVKYVIVHPNNNNDYLGFNEVFALSGKSPAMIDGNKVYYAMQDITTGICNQVSLYGEASQTQLVDIRDNNTYWVAKLEDGHCWMTQNLDLDLNPAKPLTSNDTDLTDHSLTGAYADGYNYDINTGIATWTPNSKTIDFAGRTLSGWGINNTTPRSANKTDSTETGHTSLGNYYNWTAAIASSNSTSLSANYTIANNSICPKGWRLPIATNSDQSIYEFGDLLFKQDVTTSKVGNQLSYTPNGYSNIRNNPLYLTQFGLIYNDNLNNASGGGLYWSSITMSSTDAYYLYFNSSGVWPIHHNNYYGKNNGWSIRCVAR